MSVSKLLSTFEPYVPEPAPIEQLERPYQPTDCLLEARFYDQFANMAEFEKASLYVEADGCWWEMQRIEDGKAFRYGGEPVEFTNTTMLLYSKEQWHGKRVPILENTNESK